MKSQVRRNAEKDPTYTPYCMKCSGLVRMRITGPFQWACKCGAKHDERLPSDKVPTFVVLHGVLDENYFDKFFSGFTLGQDPTKLNDGRIAYRVMGFVDTVDEAQMMLYGRTFPQSLCRQGSQ